MDDFFGEEVQLDEPEEFARAREEAERERRSEGLYYMGILQGLLLGICGNLLVAYFMEVLRSVISPKYWFATNLSGFAVAVVLVLLLTWKLLVKAGSGLYGRHYEEALKQRIRRRIARFWRGFKNWL